MTAIDCLNAANRLSAYVVNSNGDAIISDMCEATQQEMALSLKIAIQCLRERADLILESNSLL